MLTVVVDTNALFGDALLENAKWDAISEAIGDQRIRVVMPQAVFDELVARTSDELRARATEAKRLSRRTHGKARKVALKLARTIETQVETYAGDFLSRLREVGVDRVPNPSVPHSEIISRAIHRIRPFDNRGTGYRDTLIWFTLLDLIEADPLGDYAFVSSDASAFGLEDALHPDLRNDIDERLDGRGRFAWVRSLSEFEVPGYYRDEDVELDADVEARIEEAITEQLARPTELTVHELRSLDIGEADAGRIEHSRGLTIIEVIAREVTNTRSLEITYTAEFEAEIHYEALDELTDPPTLQVDTVRRSVKARGVLVGDLEGERLKEQNREPFALSSTGALASTLSRLESLQATYEQAARTSLAPALAILAAALEKPKVEIDTRQIAEALGSLAATWPKLGIEPRGKLSESGEPDANGAEGPSAESDADSDPDR